ncbi:hypothetical protein [Candidatus Vidania fulgoroideorum]
MINFRKFKKILDKKYINIKNIKKINIRKIYSIKFGIDPTYGKLHFGHFLILKTIRKLQKINLLAKIVIGCYTATIGDPSKRFYSRNEKRNIYIKKNFKKVKKEIKKILIKKKTILYNNSSWLEKINLKNIENINLTNLLCRKEIKNRIKKNDNIKVGELIYPYYQNYDNFITNPSIEIGGKDQVYNFLFGKSKCYITFELFPSLLCDKKMSSTCKKNDCIYLSDNPNKIFWKILKINDKKIEIILKFLKIKKYNLSKNINLRKKINIYFSICKNLRKKKYKNVYKNFLKKKKIIIKKKIFISLPKKIINLIHETKIFNSKNKIKYLINNGIIKNKKRILNYKNINLRKKINIYFSICKNLRKKKYKNVYKNFLKKKKIIIKKKIFISLPKKIINLIHETKIFNSKNKIKYLINNGIIKNKKRILNYNKIIFKYKKYKFEFGKKILEIEVSKV